MRNEIISDRYRILERLGEGGMAVVYTARDEKLGRVVAIKLLHQHFADNQDIRQRFEHEARAISVLDHPNIVKVFDYSGTASEQLWIVTELLKGQNLANFVRGFEGSRLHPIISACIAREICRALEHAHSREIVHRDVKPENIMVLDSGPTTIKLMDFGIAKNLHNNSLTQTGTFMGSPSYMSPEQVRGRGVDHRTDIYALGVVLYEIVTGRLPYTGNTTHDVVLKIVEGQFTKASELVADLPRDLDKIISKAMASDPERRFQHSKALGRELDLFLTRSGFVESHVELERYFGDRTVYEEKLGQLNLKLDETRHRFTERTENPPPGVAKTVRLTKLGIPDGPDSKATRKLDQSTRVHNDGALGRPKTHHATSAPTRPPRETMGPRRDRSIPPQLLPTSNRLTQTRKNVMPNIPREHLRQSVMVPPGAVEAQAVKKSQAKRRRQVPKIPKRTAHRREVIVVRTAYRPPRISLMTIAAWVTLLTVVAVAVFWYLQNVQFPNSKRIQRSLTEVQGEVGREFGQLKERIEDAVQSPPATEAEKPKVTVPPVVDRPPEVAKPAAAKPAEAKPTVQKRKPQARVESRPVVAKPKAGSRVAEQPARPAPPRPEVERRPAPVPRTEARPVDIRPVAPGKVVIRDTPPSVIYVNGELRCRIPCSAASLSFAPGTYELRAERTGFEPARQTVVIKAGETSIVRFDLQPAAKMRLVFDWDTTEVDIRVLDGSGATVSRKRFGLSTNILDLPVGEYFLELRKGGTTRQIRVSNPGAGNTRYVANPFAGGAP